MEALPMNSLLRVVWSRGHLSPFLFLLAAKGLAGLVQNAIGLNEPQGFHLNENIHFEMLQFADNTIIIYGGSWNNILVSRPF